MKSETENILLPIFVIVDVTFQLIHDQSKAKLHFPLLLVVSVDTPIAEPQHSNCCAHLCQYACRNNVERPKIPDS